MPRSYNPQSPHPYGAYFCVVDVDPGRRCQGPALPGHRRLRRARQPDDHRGAIHGGITDGIGMALIEIIAFDEEGDCLGGSLMDYLVPTAVEVPHFERATP